MATTMTGQNKPVATTLNPVVRAGQGWDYNDPNLTYDGATDPEGRQVLFDSIGTAPTMTGQSKPVATTMNTQAKP